jgi:magnesium transporter
VLTQYLDGKHRSFPITQQSFLLNINLRTAIYYLKFLKEINRRTTQIENELHQSMRNKELIRLLRMEKSLVFFNTSLKSNEIILERLQRSRWLHNDPEAEDMIDAVIIENKQASEMANIYRSSLSGMMDAFASIISKQSERCDEIPYLHHHHSGPAYSDRQHIRHECASSFQETAMPLPL